VKKFYRSNSKHLRILGEDFKFLSDIRLNSATLEGSEPDYFDDMSSSQERAFFELVDKAEQDAFLESKKMALEQGTIGPEVLAGWEFQNVEGEGNCFYLAVVEQLRNISHPFVSEPPIGTEAHDSLRLRVQGANFQDREWADHREIIELSRTVGVVVAVVDTRS
jgi:hypothetical protein